MEVSLIEELVMDAQLRAKMSDWRRWRIEWSIAEGSIWLPPDMDPMLVEELLNDER